MSPRSLATPSAAPKASFDKEDLLRDLRALGLQSGDLVNAKVSLKSIGHVEGGADALLEALLEAVGPAGTIVTESFVDVYPVPLSEENSRNLSGRSTPSYAGALANALVRHPRAVRSTHPVQKFAAIGARAEELMSAHTPQSYAYDVLRVMAEEGARNLKIGSDEKTIGVGTTHVAIGLLRLRQKRPRAGRAYVDDGGRVVTFERDWAGACAEGFINFIPYYRPASAILSEGRVGLAEAKITDMKRTLAVELELLRQNPSLLMCNDPACVNCQLAWDFSTGSLGEVILQNLRKGRFRAILAALRTRFNRNYLPK